MQSDDGDEDDESVSIQRPGLAFRVHSFSQSSADLLIFLNIVNKHNNIFELYGAGGDKLLTGGRWWVLKLDRV